MLPQYFDDAAVRRRGEAALAKGFGVGAEISALGARQSFGDSAMGVFSANGYYHFKHEKDARTDPFVTGGYTLMFRSGHAKSGELRRRRNVLVPRTAGRTARNARSV